jgi:hypothetical protein
MCQDSVCPVCDAPCSLCCGYNRRTGVCEKTVADTLLRAAQKLRAAGDTIASVPWNDLAVGIIEAWAKMVRRDPELIYRVGGEETLKLAQAINQENT